MYRCIRTAVSEIVLRTALLVLAAPVLPVTEQIGGLFQHVSDELDRVRIGR